MNIVLRRAFRISSVSSYGIRNVFPVCPRLNSTLNDPMERNANGELIPNAKVRQVADSIASLNMLEVTALNKLLVSMFDIPENNHVGMMPMRMMQVAAPVGAPAAAAAAAPAAAAAVPEPEKTSFEVRLDKFDASSKIKVIKEVRGFTNLGLKEAKDLVEGAPKTIKEGVSKEDAAKIKAAVEAAGGTVSIL